MPARNFDGCARVAVGELWEGLTLGLRAEGRRRKTNSAAGVCQVSSQSRVLWEGRARVLWESCLWEGPHRRARIEIGWGSLVRLIACLIFLEIGLWGSLVRLPDFLEIGGL